MSPVAFAGWMKLPVLIRASYLNYGKSNDGPDSQDRGDFKVGKDRFAGLTLPPKPSNPSRDGTVLGPESQEQNKKDAEK